MLHRDSGPPLLTAFAAGALAIVAMVAWLAHARTDLVLAAALALVLAVAGSMTVRLARLLAQDEQAPSLPASRALWVVPALVVLVLAVVVAAVAAAPRGAESPAATVRAFLGDAVVDNDGGTACTYLTPAARVDIEGHSGDGPTCTSFFGTASLGTVSSDAQVSALRYTVVARGPDRVVTAGSMRFVLQPANTNESTAYDAPASHWRIASNVTVLG